MSQYNPYEPPRADSAYVPAEAATGDDAAVPEPIIEELRGTRPWILFLAILGFLGTGLMVLLGLAMFAMAGAAGMPAPFGLIYIAFAAVYLLPAIYLIRYGSSIALLVRDPRMERLGSALGAQRRFWKMVGIMAAVILALYPIGAAGVFVYYVAKGFPK
jgi:hypothetical protein